jgi:hypothetical protein
MNIFEGSRRVLYAVTAITITFMAWAAWQHEPYIEAGLYSTMSSGETVAVKSCPDPAGYRANAGIARAEVMLTICGDQDEREIRLNKLELARLEGLVSAERIEKSQGFGSQAAASLAALWLVSWIIGWIVRGFAGIPRGQDKK